MKKVIVKSKNKKHLNEILNEWCNMVEDYTNNYCSSDALYWYNERATLSTFAVSAGRKDFYVLEEYSAYKKGNESGSKYSGRIDLFLAKGNSVYLIEAKQEWVSISPRAKVTINKINKTLKSACNDAAKSNLSCKANAYGLAFIIPYITKNDLKQEKDFIKKFISKLSGVDYDALAYVFPEEGEVVNAKTKKSFPGVVCLIRAPRRLS